MKQDLTNQDYIAKQIKDPDELLKELEDSLRWHDKLYLPVYRFFRWTIWERIRPGKWKHWYERARYGHSYQDQWSIDYWLVDNLIPMLKQIKYERHGTPMEFFRKKDGVDRDGNPTDEATVLADKRYDEVLDKMIYGLKCGRTIQNLDYDYNSAKKTKQMMKSVEKSFQLIGKHLFSLWD